LLPQPPKSFIVLDLAMRQGHTVNEVNPIINIDAAELKPGGNASKFVNRTARLAPKIGLRTLGWAWSTR
jgi:hypothetical protein